MNNEFVLLSTRILCGPRTLDGGIVVRDGIIDGVVAREDVPKRMTVIDVGNHVVMPGIVDTHAHINEPGRTEWEGFETATQAAAAGGITTVIDMPLNSIPPTTTVANLEIKAAAAAGHCAIDYGFWGGLVPGNAGQLALLAGAGVKGFKCFLVESGVDEFKCVGQKDLLEAMPLIAKTGLPLIVHAELDQGATTGGDPRAYQTYLTSRPRSWENSAVQLMIDLCRKTGCRVHIVHLSSSDALGPLAQARAEGLPITAETCPHYLVLASEEIPDGSTQYKCAPPIRERENRERLWQGIRQGEIDFIVSDHSPCTPNLKLLEQGDFMQAWGGIASLQFGLSLVWTQFQARGLTLNELSRLMCCATAEFVGLGKRKGSIVSGYDADFVIWNPDAEFKLEPAMIRHRHSITPYVGQKLCGVVEMTILRGNKIYEKGRLLKKASGVRV